MGNTSSGSSESAQLKHHARTASLLSFARALVFGGEAKELLFQGFLFPSAVSAYYTVLHLGNSLALAHYSYGGGNKNLEKKWEKARRKALSRPDQYVPDPAACVSHNDVADFLKTDVPELFLAMETEPAVPGLSGEKGTLRDMREFVSYGPRVLRRGSQLLRYTGCQYEPAEFKEFLKKHLSNLDGRFALCVKRLAEKGYDEVRDDIFRWHFFVNQFGDLCSYRAPAAASPAIKIYAALCAKVGKDPRDFTPEDSCWVPAEEEAERLAERETFTALIGLLEQPNR